MAVARTGNNRKMNHPRVRVRRIWWYWRHYLEINRLRKTIVYGYSLRDFDTLGCIFIHIPRTAGVSIARSLFGHLAGGHRTVDEYRAIFGRKLFKRYFKFAFVRDPFMRVASAFYFLKAGGFNRNDRRWAEMHIADCRDLDDFCLRRLGNADVMNWIHFRPQWRFVCNSSGNILVDFIGRFENLHADFSRVAARLGKDVVLAHQNRSPRGTSVVGDDLSRRAKLVVSEVYRRDFEIFGYPCHHQSDPK